MVETQKELDWSRGARLAMLDQLTIDVSQLDDSMRDEITNSRGLMLRLKALLRSIDSFAGNDSECWASVAAIAARMGCCQRHARRCLSLAKSLGLVIAIPGRHQTTSIHDINWSLVWDWSGVSISAPQTGHQCQSDRTSVSSDRTSVSSDRTTQSADPKRTIHEPQIKTIMVGDGFLKEDGLAHASPSQTGGSAHAKPPVSDGLPHAEPSVSGGWPMPVTAQTLNSISALESLWEHTQAQAWVLQSDRIRFFTLCRYCRRRANEGAIKSAGGTLTVLLRAKKWYGNDTDEQDARKIDRQIRTGVHA